MTGTHPSRHCPRPQIFIGALPPALPIATAAPSPRRADDPLAARARRRHGPARAPRAAWDLSQHARDVSPTLGGSERYGWRRVGVLRFRSAPWGARRTAGVARATRPS